MVRRTKSLMPKSLQVLGIFNTGTNLIYNILSNYRFLSSDFMYKHEINLDIIEKNIHENSNIFIIMYKPLYNWLFSIQKASYSIEFTEKKFDDEIKYVGKNFQNIIELYNEYYSMYKKLLIHDNVIMINYFKMIDPLNGFKYLQKKLRKLGFDYVDEQFYRYQLNKSSKTHGKPVKNADEAINRKDQIKIQMQNFVHDNQSLKNSLNEILYHELDFF